MSMENRDCKISNDAPETESERATTSKFVGRKPERRSVAPSRNHAEAARRTAIAYADSTALPHTGRSRLLLQQLERIPASAVSSHLCFFPRIHIHIHIHIHLHLHLRPSRSHSYPLSFLLTWTRVKHLELIQTYLQCLDPPHPPYPPPFFIDTKSPLSSHTRKGPIRYDGKVYGMLHSDGCLCPAGGTVYMYILYSDNWGIRGRSRCSKRARTVLSSRWPD